MRSSGEMASIPAPLHDRARRRARERVGREGAGAAAEHVARELVEHDDQREAAPRRLQPVGQAAGGGAPVQGQKPREDFRVESLVFGEPVLALALEPELEDLIGPHARIMPVNEAPGRAL